MTREHDRRATIGPYYHGYFRGILGDRIFPSPKTDWIEMLKTAFCMVLASWMTLCIMMIIYSREVAEFVFERVQ